MTKESEMEQVEQVEPVEPVNNPVARYICRRLEPVMPGLTRKVEWRARHNRIHLVVALADILLERESRLGGGVYQAAARRRCLVDNPADNPVDNVANGGTE
jgi:hypothetical protein